MTTGTAITLENVSKFYPGVVALSNISLEIKSGTCHGLVGENGAGKSTLGKLLAGLVRPDTGSIRLFGQTAAFRNPRDAQQAGVSVVHQELVFCENMSVSENLCLDSLPHKGLFVDRKQVAERALGYLRAIGSEIDPNELVRALPIGMQQLVQIAGAIGRGARIIVFDEPTSSLSSGETRRLIAQIQALKAQGITCIYVSHRMEEIFELCDAVSVLRDGVHVETGLMSAYDKNSLVKLMVGRTIESSPRSRSFEAAPVALETDRLSSPGKFESVSLRVAKGEIVGVAGLVGAGRTEVAEALFGIDQAATGVATLHGQRLSGTARARLQQGLGFVTEDRKRFGLAMNLNVRENAVLTILSRLASFGWVNARKEREEVARLIDLLKIKTASPDAPILSLSGGNQQKVVLAKWLAAQCEALVLDEPTRGVDVGAKAEIHREIRAFVDQGKAALVISSELPELLGLCDRIYVMRLGKIVAEFETAQASEAALLEAMTGVTAES